MMKTYLFCFSETNADVVESCSTERDAETVSEQQLGAANKTQTTKAGGERSDSSEAEVEEDDMKMEESNTQQEVSGF